MSHASTQNTPSTTAASGPGRRPVAIVCSAAVLAGLAAGSLAVHPRHRTTSVATAGARSLVCANPGEPGAQLVAGIANGRAEVTALPGPSRAVSGMMRIAAGSTPWLITPTGADQPVAGVLGATSWTPCASASARSTVTLDDAGGYELVLVNPDATAISVNLTFLTPHGVRSVAGARGLVVQPHGSRTVPLGVVAGRGFTGIDVETDAGRVMALARPVTSDAPGPVRGRPLSTSQVIPGLAAGSQSVQVELTNPGTSDALVDVGALTAKGALRLQGAQQVRVPAGSALQLDLTRAVGGEAMSLLVTSTRPVSASAVVTPRSGSASVHVSQDPSPQRVGLAPNDASMVLVNPGTAAASVQVVVTTGSTPSTTARVVPAGSEVNLTIPRGSVVHVSSAHDVAAALVLGQAIIPTSDAAEPGSVTLVNDPTLH